MPKRVPGRSVRKQKSIPGGQGSAARYPRNVRGRQVCITVTKTGVSLYGNRQAFRSLSGWMQWLAGSKPAEHNECHMMWHFSLPTPGKKSPVWTPFDRETGVAFSKSGRRQFDVTFMVVENSDLSKLRDAKLSGNLPAAWNPDPPLRAAALFREAQTLWRRGRRIAALKKYRQAAESGVPEYEIALGEVLIDETYPSTADFKAGYKWILRAATKGEPNAQYWIARELATGENVKRNPGRAAEWYRRAARRALASAQYNLGMMYFEGDGVPKSKALARRWIARAADQGEILAKMLLADAHTTGELGFPIDPRKAAHWRSQVNALERRSRRAASERARPGRP